MEGARPLWAGDTLQGTGGARGEEVLGFIVVHDTHAGLNPDVDPSEDYVLSAPHGLARRRRPYAEVLERQWSPTAQHPLEGASLHEVGHEWAERFHLALTFHDHPWASMTLPLIERAASVGWHIVPVGGLVRDILLGVDPTDTSLVNDMDIAGTAPTVQYRRFVFDHLVESANFEPWRRNTFPHLRTSPNQVVHLKRVRQVGDVLEIDRSPTLQYAALKKDRVLLEGGPTRLLSGSSFVADSAWRDIGYNSLFYDPLAKAIIDPSGRGLTELGLTSADLKSDPATVQRARLVVHPFDIPEFEPEVEAAMLWMNAVARIVKQVAAFGTAADYAACGSWFAAHESRLSEYVATVPAAAPSLASKFTELRAGLAAKAKAFPSAAVLRATLGKEFASWLEANWRERRGDPLSRTGGAVTKAPLRLVGYGLAIAAGENEPYSLGVVEAPDASTSEAASSYFAERLAGYQRRLVDVTFEGSTYTVLGLVDPLEFGPTYVETVNNAPIPATERDLYELTHHDLQQ